MAKAFVNPLMWVQFGQQSYAMCPLISNQPTFTSITGLLACAHSCKCWHKMLQTFDPLIRQLGGGGQVMLADLLVYWLEDLSDFMSLFSCSAGRSQVIVQVCECIWWRYISDWEWHFCLSLRKNNKMNDSSFSRLVGRCLSCLVSVSGKGEGMVEEVLLFPFSIAV